ncbi:hypothetical protein PG993_001883 [Apiospora rasikravindrae]|uniref:Uncharacterized protein n=1 Tax=Apiospora rasikravindrae TaxID=990691 RepID=A0ABR1UCP0_9PEZI
MAFDEQMGSTQVSPNFDRSQYMPAPRDLTSQNSPPSHPKPPTRASASFQIGVNPDVRFRKDIELTAPDPSRSIAEQLSHSRSSTVEARSNAIEKSTGEVELEDEDENETMPPQGLSAHYNEFEQAIQVGEKIQGRPQSISSYAKGNAFKIKVISDVDKPSKIHQQVYGDMMERDF